MESASMNNSSPNSADMSAAIFRWYRFSKEAMDDVMKISQPLWEVYLKGLSTMMPELENIDLRKINALYRGYDCNIPETECPPYCVCEMEWDACEGGTVTGSIEIKNTGKQSISFNVSADTFRSHTDNSGVAPQLSPANFTLAPGEARIVGITVKAEDNFNQSDTYISQVKVRGRYEQCVRLKLRVRHTNKPVCSVEHGEIPKRIVAHNWYDHFQCEELCFQPVSTATFNDQPSTGVVGATVANDANLATAPAAKRRTRKKATKKRAAAKKKS